MVDTQVAKAKQSEIVRWENRLEYLRNEHTNLTKLKEQTQQTIDAKRSEYEIYIGSRERDLRDRTEKLAQDRKAFEAQQEAFKAMLNTHQLEKNALASEKSDFDKEKQVIGGKRQGVNDFIQAVRRAYNVLPE